MAISDLFSTSFLFSISIIVLLVGATFAYVSYRMGEQDHKLNSMIGLISTMAEESRFFRSKLTMLQQKIDNSEIPENNHLHKMHPEQELINVSDDDTEEEEDESEEEEDESEEEDVSEDDSDYSVSDDENKMLNLSSINDDVNNEELDENDIEDLSFDSHEDIKTIHLKQPIDLEETEISEVDITLNDDNKISQEDMNLLKNVSITDLGKEDGNTSSKTDYKKMAINKLREIVVSKGLVIDASKLKKAELVKMLEDA